MARGKVPLPILEKRVISLNNIIRKRGGKSFKGQPSKGKKVSAKRVSKAEINELKGLKFFV